MMMSPLCVSTLLASTVPDTFICNWITRFFFFFLARTTHHYVLLPSRSGRAQDAVRNPQMLRASVSVYSGSAVTLVNLDGFKLGDGAPKDRSAAWHERPLAHVHIAREAVACNIRVAAADRSMN